uniref:Ionotropic receptor 87a n=1 Tax=Bradysia odoriphaga TaxID=1564500 RepID=A0A6B9C8N7_9DIPT|nr:ionotropic receptor 87a [Bradysia odoriphaga]
MKGWLCYIFVFIKLVRAFSNNDHDVQHDSIPCIRRFCQHYFRSDIAMKGSLVIMNLTPSPSTFQTRIIESLNEDVTHEFSVMIKDSRKKHMNASHVSEKAQNYFMFIVSYEDVNSTVHQWRSLPTWNPMAQVMGLFTEVFDPEILAEQIRNVFDELLLHNMLNVNLMYRKAGTNIVEMITWFPYEGENCANRIVNLRVIDNCEYQVDPTNTSDINVVFNPKRKEKKIPHHLHGCSLKISSSVWPPYTYYDSESGEFTKGIEVLLVQTIAKVLHLTTVYNVLNETRENRLSSKLTPGYVDLMDGTSDVLIGGMDEDSNTRKYLSSSIPYYQDDQTWCVANAKPEELWRNIFNLFSTTIWSLIILVVFLMASMLYGFIKMDHKSENFMWMLLASLSVTMGLTTIYDPKHTNARIVFFIFLFYGLLFSTLFNSFLVGVLTNPRQKEQISNLHQAVAANLEFNGGTVTLEHFDAKDEVTTKARKSYNLCDNIDNCFYKLTFNDYLAVATSREHAMNSPVVPTSDIFCFAKADNIYTFSVAMMTKKYYHLLPQMNSIIRRVSEFGLLEKWAKDNSAATLELIQSSDSGNDDDDGLVVLTVGHITGALMIMFLGYAVAVCAFVGEIIVAKQISSSRRKSCWLFWDKVFDNKQYF